VAKKKASSAEKRLQRARTAKGGTRTSGSESSPDQNGKNGDGSKRIHPPTTSFHPHVTCT
jgi:hypothetical protein